MDELTELEEKARDFFYATRPVTTPQIINMLADFARSLGEWTAVEIEPEPTGRLYLVTLRNGTVCDSGGFINRPDVIAWRELPAGYQPQAKEAEQT